MSAKKKEKSEWKLCLSCETHFPRGVCMRHEKKCGNGDTEDDPSLYSGFIRNGELDGICKSVIRENDLVPSTKNDLIIVHPSAIKLCKFQTISSVLIKYEGRQTCGTIWPSSSMPVDGIGLQLAKMKTLKVEEGKIVNISELNVPWIIADKVYLRPTSDAARQCFDSVSSTLLFDLDGGNIMKGDTVSIPYYGCEHFYVVTDFIGDYLKHNKDASDLNDSLETKNQDALNLRLETEQLEEKMLSLSVNGNEVAKEDQINSNTFIYSVMINSTQLLLIDEKQDILKTEKNKLELLLDRLGGLSSQIELLKELVEVPFNYPLLFNECGIAPPKGIIIHGVSGTGKTSLVHGFVDRLPNVFKAIINGPELASKFHGETEERLRSLFNKTKGKAPSVLIIDEFDVICPARTSSTTESEKRIVSTLATLLDSIQKEDIFAVIAITSKLEQIDLSLRRPGRFDREIEIGVPNATERRDILRKLLMGCKHCLSNEEIAELSDVTHGYVGSDLTALVKEAGMIVLKNMKLGMDKTNVESLVDSFSITASDFRSAMCNIRPSAMKAVMIDIPKVFWSDIGGQYGVKQKMKEAIEWPLKHPHVFKRMGISPPRGLLMYGPPGCSKTLTAKAIATESGLNFISIKGPELFDKYLGESEKAIRDVFSKARVSAPSIVFFDEIDAIGVQRSNKDSGSNNVGDRVLAQLLTELDGVESLDGVIVIAATNRPDIIDPALLRPGRIDRLIYVPLPDETTRKEIFEIQFRSMPICKDVDLDTLISMSVQYSGAEICSLCREAAMMALRENFDCNQISFKHFKMVFDQIKPAISNELISFYDNFRNKTTGTF